MENKELDKVIEELGKLIERLDVSNMKRELASEMEKAINEPATISITKNANGEACTKIEGKTLPLLITLAGLETSILKQLDVPTGLWETVKRHIGTMEV